MNQFDRSSVTSGLHFSANKIKDLGNTVLSNGQTIENHFAIDNVSIWKCGQPDMALHILPPILFKSESSQFYLSISKLYLKKIKYQIKQMQGVITGHFFKNSSKCSKERWFLLASSEYIYRDSLSPLSDYLRSNSGSVDIDNYSSFFKNSNRVIFFSKEWFKRIKLFIRLKRKLNNQKNVFFNNEISRLCILHPEIPERGIYLLFYWFTNIFIERNIINLLNAENCFKYNAPNVIISGDVADPINRIYIEIAKKNSIPTVDIQFGLYDDSSVEWQFCLTDRVIVWGKLFYNLFNEVHNIEKSRIMILGSPRFDYLCKNDKVPYTNKSKKINLLFASMYTAISDYDTSYDVSLIMAFKKMVISVCRELEDLVQLTIKPHPLEDVSWIKDIGHNNFCKILEKHDDIREYIGANDVFLTFGSTATFDALLRNKMVLSANTPGLVWWDDLFLKEGVSYSIDSEASFKNFIMDYCSIHNERMLKDNKIRISNFLNNKIVYTDETSSERIIRLISSLI